MKPGIRQNGCFQASEHVAGRRPLMELLRGDEPGPGAAVPEATRLPPGVVLHADDAKDVPSFEGHRCILAWNGGVVIRVVVKQSPHKQLRKDNRKVNEYQCIHSSLLPKQLCEVLLNPRWRHNIFVWGFFTRVGVIFEKWR